MYSVEQLNHLFSDLLSVTANKQALEEGETVAVTNMLDCVRKHCEKKNVTIPKNILEVHNEQSINLYVRGELKRSEEKLGEQKKKMKMFSLALSVLETSEMNTGVDMSLE